MEQRNRVQTKITVEGLVLEICTKNKQIMQANQNAYNNFAELYANRRLNSEFSAILKFSNLPKSLLSLTAYAHDFFSAKHFPAASNPFSPQSLQIYLNSLVSHSFTSIEEVATRVFLANRICLDRHLKR